MSSRICIGTCEKTCISLRQMIQPVAIYMYICISHVTYYMLYLRSYILSIIYYIFRPPRNQAHMMPTPMGKYVTFHCNIDELGTYHLGDCSPPQVHRELNHIQTGSENRDKGTCISLLARTWKLLETLTK